MNKYLSDHELFEIFPEGRLMVVEQIEAWEEKKKNTVHAFNHFKKRARAVYDIYKEDKNWNSFFIYYWCYLVPQHLFDPKIKAINKHLAILYRQKKLFVDEPSEEKDKIIAWEEKVDTAKKRPLLSLYDFQKPRHIGKRISALCPFHNERTPSFVIYEDQNMFHCFSCQKHGDSISFVMLLNRYSFREAVSYLQ